jgi:hypothetical protein
MFEVQETTHLTDLVKIVPRHPLAEPFSERLEDSDAVQDHFGDDLDGLCARQDPLHDVDWPMNASGQREPDRELR